MPCPRKTELLLKNKFGFIYLISMPLLGNACLGVILSNFGIFEESFRPNAELAIGRRHAFSGYLSEGKIKPYDEYLKIHL